jgi:hypothetical protein
MRSRSLVLIAIEGCLLTACSRQPSDVRPTVAALPDWSGAWSSDETAQVGDPRSASAAPLAPKYAAMRVAAGTKPDPAVAARCLDPGMPGIMDHGATFEFVFSSGRVTMIFQDGSVRRIYTDGRPHPDPARLYFSVEGHSVGRWEGATLVVDTIGMDTRAELFAGGGMTVTKHTQIVERMFRKDASTIQIDTVVTDPELFTRPYSYTWAYSNFGAVDDFPGGCARNNRDNGTDIDLTPPPLTVAAS